MSSPPTDTEQWPETPHLLTLPLEIRLNIYSRILLNKHTKVFFRDDMNISAYSLSVTCHQLNFEALDYYYAHNIFRLELGDPDRLPSQVEENNEEQYKILWAHLARVQKLELEMYVKNSRFYHVEQKAQLSWVCGTLIQAKELKIGNKTLLKSIVVAEKARLASMLMKRECMISMPKHVEKFWQMEIAHIEEILGPLRGRIQELVVFDQEVAFG